MLATVISGGQTGVDQAALRAARIVGIQTGGTAALNFMTEDGPAPWLAEYGLVECEAPGYPARTRRNVNSAHATLIVAYGDSDDYEGGMKLTFDVAFAAGKRGAGLYVADLARPDVDGCRRWLAECAAAHPTLGGKLAFVLNVAGPRESKSPGVGAQAETFLRQVFARD